MNHQAKLLGFAGLIPFVGLPLLIYLDALGQHDAARYFNQYSAVILSFFGGVHWHDALQNNRYRAQIYVAMLPSIVAWLALITLPLSQALMVFPLAYGLMLIYDIRTLTLPIIPIPLKI